MIEQTILSLTLLVAGVGKLRSMPEFQLHLAGRMSSAAQARLIAAAVVAFELVAGFAVWTQARTVTVWLIALFLSATSMWLVSGKPMTRALDIPTCGCFGPNVARETRRVHRRTANHDFAISVPRPAWWAIRNGTLVGLALLTAYSGLNTAMTVAYGISLIAIAMSARTAWAVRTVPGPRSSRCTF